jgi:hypothetical protein
MYTKQNPIILACLAVLAALSFILGPTTLYANAYTPANCNNQACVIFDNSQYPSNNYFIDHAMNVLVKYPTTQGSTIRVTVTSTLDSTGCTLTFNNTQGTNMYTLSTTYIYLTTGSSDCSKPSIKVSSTDFTNQITVTESPTSVANVTGDQSSTYGTLPAAGAQPNLLAKPSCISSTSGDGICDEWKKTGPVYGIEIPYGKNGAIYKWYCNHSNPDPLNVCPQVGTPDIYMEIDYMTGHKPDATALRNLVNSFALNHIRLHILVDQDIQYHRDSTAPPSAGNADNTAWDNIKKVYFGTANETSTGSSAYISDLLTAKRFAFHYMLITHSQPGGYSGSSETPGNDIDISLGAQSGGGGIGTPDQQAGTMMHELGHNLNLLHGGGDSIMCKPNYLSVMNYLYQFSTLLPSQRPLNYSRDSNTLSSPVSENNGVPTTYSASNAPYVVYGNSGVAYTARAGSQSGNSCIDWDKSGTCGGSDSSPNISYVSTISGCPNPTVYSLNGFNDWGNLKIDMFYPTEPASMQDGGPNIPSGGECPTGQIWFADTQSCRPFGDGIDTYWYFIIALVIIIGILAWLHAKPPKFFTKIKAGP